MGNHRHRPDRQHLERADSRRSRPRLLAPGPIIFLEKKENENEYNSETNNLPEPFREEYRNDRHTRFYPDRASDSYRDHRNPRIDPDPGHRTGPRTGISRKMPNEYPPAIARDAYVCR